MYMILPEVHSCFFILRPPSSEMDGQYIYKESVELTFIYQVGGCGKTCNNNKRCDTPHLDSLRQVCRTHTTTQLDKEECCSPSLSLETTTFPTSDNTKTLSKNVLLFTYRGVKHNKDKKCFSFEQHFTGYRIINKSKMLRYTVIVSKMQPYQNKI